MADAEALRLQGNEAFAAKRFDEAVDLYSSAIALNATDFRLFTNRSIVLSKQGEHFLSFSDATFASDISCLSAKAWVRKATALEALREFVFAEDVLKCAKQVLPGDPHLKELEAKLINSDRTKPCNERCSTMRFLWKVVDMDDDEFRRQRKLYKHMLELGVECGMADLALFAMPVDDDTHMELEESSDSTLMFPVRFIIKESQRVLPTLIYCIQTYQGKRLNRVIEIISYLFERHNKTFMTKGNLVHIDKLAAVLCQLLDDTPHGRAHYQFLRKRQYLNTSVLGILRKLRRGLSLPLARRLFMRDAVDLDMYGAFRETCQELNLPISTDRCDLALDARTSTICESRRLATCRLINMSGMLANFGAQFGTSLPATDSWAYTPKCGLWECTDMETRSKPHEFSCSRCEKVHYCSRECAMDDDLKGHARLCPGGARPGDKERRNPSTVPEQKHCGNCLAPESAVVGSEGKFKKCSKCQVVKYCGPFCQEYHWKIGGHKKECGEGL
ncbi:Hsp90 cochaperone [Podochytrium sp. JEL0797]|nr:Hsp90 cochaperone [Podochytrium sp. JEL0797]